MSLFWGFISFVEFRWFYSLLPDLDSLPCVCLDFGFLTVISFLTLQEVAGYQRAIIVSYINEISQSLEEMPESERDRPLHKPSVRLLVELLRQIMVKFLSKSIQLCFSIV